MFTVFCWQMQLSQLAELDCDLTEYIDVICGKLFLVLLTVWQLYHTPCNKIWKKMQAKNVTWTS